LILLAIVSYRFLATRDKDSVSVETKPASVPAETAIQAFIRNRVAKSARTGETITALVTTPVILEGKTMIPSGAQFEGNLEALSVRGARGEATIDFTALRLDGHDFPIQAHPVTATIPVKSDTEILANALRALTGAGFGAALGAVSGDPSLINRGMLEGAIPSLSSDIGVPITIVLVSDLKLDKKLPS
jgi:hypothetical protein